MYAREVGDRTLSFGVSGMLFRDGLVMYDRETDTLWTQVDSRAIKGALEGATLEIVPAIHATWEEWKALYPDSLVLKKRTRGRSAYRSYDGTGVLGRRLRDERFSPDERIIGVRTDRAVMAFPEKAVREERLVEAAVGSLPVVLVAAAEGLPVVTFDRRVEGRVLSFRLEDEPSPTLVDAETGTRWRITDGEAVEGALKGRRLSRAPAYPAFWFGWTGYFPSTLVWEP